MPNLLDLPTELLIHIFSGLYIADFGSCLLTCHRLKDIIQNSRLIQYLIRTALAGVYDPLLPSGPPLLDRLELLERWSAAWQEPSAHLRAPSRILAHRTELNADFLLRDDYLVVVDYGQRHGPRRVASYEWLDLRKPGNDWTNIRFEENLVPLAFALDVAQQNLLAGLFGCPETATFQLRLLGFHDGLPHPLAPRPFLGIPLPTKELHSVGLKIRMSMIGPYIVIAAGLPPGVTGVDVLLLVEWQKGPGHVTELRRTHTRTYLTDFLVLSDDVLALVHGLGNAIELCRVSTTPTASLQIIRHLGLPPLLPHARLVASSSKTENNPTPTDVHHCGPSRPPPRYPFSPSQADSLVLLTLSARISGPPFARTQTYTLVTHTRTLLSYASPSSSSSVDPSTGLAEVPWDVWGPHATRCFEGHSGTTSAVATGQRWLTRGTIRDFCPRRLRRRWAGDVVTLSPSSLPDNCVFAHDIVSALPYREVRLATENDNGVLLDDALIDRERVTFFVPGANKNGFAFHVHMMG